MLGASFPSGTAMLTYFGGDTFDQVVLAVEKSEPARLRLFDDVDLDPVDERQALAAHLGRDGLRLGASAGAILAIESSR